MPLSRVSAAVPVARKRQLLNSYEIRLMVAELVQRQGQSLADIFTGTGLSARLLDNPALRLTLEQELQLYTRIANRNRDPLLGIRTGARLSLPNYGILGHAMMGAASVQEALQLLTEFAPLVSWASHSTLSNESLAGQRCKCLTIVPTAADPVAAALEIESTFASLQALFNDLLGEAVAFASIEMTHSNAGQSLQAYRTHFACPVRFDSTRNALLLPRTLLARRLPHPQPEYSELFRDLCRQSMSALALDRGLVATVRSLMEREHAAIPSLEQLAKHFRQSSRTLRRHLDAAGVSYRSLLDEVRYDSACRYLSATGLTVEVIGKRLGYADARSFRTAFKRWAGVAPAHYRRANTGSG